MRFCKIILSIFIFTIISGCSDNAANPSETGNSIVPLKVGNQWIFRTYFIDTSGVLKEEDEFFDTLSVIGTEVYKNENWFVMSYESERKNSAGIYYLLNRANGLWRSDFINQEEHLAKFPARKGDVFPALYYYNQSGDSLIPTSSMNQVIATDTIVTTPAGTFNCFAYRDIQDSTHRFVSTLLYSPGIGFIAERVVSRYDKENWGSELVSYSLK